MDDRAIARALDLGELIEADLDQRQKNPLLLPLVAYAREQAIDAMRQLIWVNPADPRDVMKQQAEVQRCVDLVRWVRESQAAAKEAWDLVSEEEKETYRTWFPPPDEDPNDA